MIVRAQDFGGGAGEVDGLAPQLSVFAPGEGEQRLEQPFLPLAGGDHIHAHLPQSGHVCVGVGQRGLGERELEADLAAHLVSGVGDVASFWLVEGVGGGGQHVCLASGFDGAAVAGTAFARGASERRRLRVEACRQSNLAAGGGGRVGEVRYSAVAHAASERQLVA